ncbi:hypothetical protein ABMA32_03560 [Mesorhizobium sp. VNQ89]|uniref:hypothetical protein n=1 Tax=Mesorhizobium quangtriensis TaxID=3157709 RepID=UPI0032B7F0EA
MTALQTFIEQCLDPIPGDALLDTHYNMLARRARLDPWRRAEAKKRYYDALRDAECALSFQIGQSSLDVEVTVPLPSRDRLFELAKKAQYDLLLTPAERKADVDWKDRHKKYFGFSQSEMACIERAIASDRAFIAAHPTARTGRRARQS